MRLEGKKIAVLVAEGFEDLEYWVTVMRLQEEGPRSSLSDPIPNRLAARTRWVPRPTRQRMVLTPRNWTAS